MTTLELSVPEMDLQIKILSQLGKRERRAILHSFYRQIKPWMEHFRGAIDHNSDGIIRSSRMRKRGIKLCESAPVTSLSGAIGFEIRMKRLKLGMTQTQLSDQLGIARTHLSDIERGVHLPRPETRAAIEQALKVELYSGLYGSPNASAVVEDELNFVS